ncbi:MAG: YbaB/EbfC family nucleoid-associated protein [Candidatus Obscuribacterales bacterium]|nr:YbaB/EbfC family nucleoid-associated protein [Cyanobacteria bacterium SZAS LIN-5]
MGNFYSNITLSTGERDKVINFLIEQKRHTFVYPIDDFICVFPKHDSVLFELAEQLSALLKCPAFAVMIHDDDLLIYKLFDSGKLLDQYNSCPGYFSGVDQPSSGGDPEKLCLVYSAPDEVEALEEILRKNYTFESNRHDAIIAKLNLPYCTVGSGFGYLERDETPDDLVVADLIETAPDDQAGDTDPESGSSSSKGRGFVDLDEGSHLTKNAVASMLNDPELLQRAWAKAKAGADDYVKAMMETEVKGSSGGGAVVITSKGNLQFTGVKLSPEAINAEDVGMLEDLVLCALNDVAQQTRVKMEATKKSVLNQQLGQLGL